MKHILIIMSIFMVAACGNDDGMQKAPPLAKITATVETDMMQEQGDTADDPAIWYRSGRAEDIRILGTNKVNGLFVYDLQGKTMDHLPLGLINNVDLVEQPNKTLNLAVASNDGLNTITLFSLHQKTGKVSHVGDVPVHKKEPYGICLGRAGKNYRAAVTYKDGTVQLWSFAANFTNSATHPSAPEAVMKLGGKLEGCVFDKTGARLFVGEEEYGVWLFDLNDPTLKPREIIKITRANKIVEDIEGLTLYEPKKGADYLLFSSQGADTYYVLQAEEPFAICHRFKITDNEAAGIDRVTHTDGIAVLARPISSDYPNGIFVVQDDENEGVSGQIQNFKYIDWRQISAGFDPSACQ